MRMTVMMLMILDRNVPPSHATPNIVNTRLRVLMLTVLSQNGPSPTHDTESPLKSNLKSNGGGQVDYKKVISPHL